MIEDDGWYMVVIEQGEDSYGAYVPDLPGCVAVGDTREEVLEIIQEDCFAFGNVARRWLPIPRPHSVSEYVAVPA